MSVSTSSRATAEAEGEPAGGFAWIPSLDGFRAIVIWLIVSKHLWNAGGRPESIGLLDTLMNSGVFFKLFYVISGFVLFLPIAARAGRLGSGAGRWILRRFARITPSYYLVLLIVLLAYPVLIGPEQPDSRSVGSVLAHLTYLQEELYPQTPGFGVNGPVWALSIFALFYLTLPLIARSFDRRPLPWAAGAVAVSAVWASLVADPETLRQYPFFLQDFAFGMLAAWLLVRLNRRDGWRRAVSERGREVCAIAALALVGLIASTYAAGAAGGDSTPLTRHSELVSALVPFCFALLVLAVALAPAAVQRPLSGRTAAFLANTSLGVFLIHMVWIKFVVHNLEALNAVLSTALVVALSLGFGYLSYRFIERPVRDRVRGRRPPPPAAPGPADPRPSGPPVGERSRELAR